MPSQARKIGIIDRSPAGQEAIEDASETVGVGGHRQQHDQRHPQQHPCNRRRQDSNVAASKASITQQTQQRVDQCRDRHWPARDRHSQHHAPPHDAPTRFGSHLLGGGDQGDPEQHRQWRRSTDPGDVSDSLAQSQHQDGRDHDRAGSILLARPDQADRTGEHGEEDRQQRSSHHRRVETEGGRGEGPAHRECRRDPFLEGAGFDQDFTAAHHLWTVRDQRVKQHPDQRGDHEAAHPCAPPGGQRGLPPGWTGDQQLAFSVFQDHLAMPSRISAAISSTLMTAFSVKKAR